MQKNYQALEDFLQENNVTYNKNRPFKECTSFSVGGIVDLYVTVKNVDELLSLLVFLNKNNIKYFVIKDKNKFLVSDDGYEGVIISMEGSFEDFEFLDDCMLKANSSAILERLSHEARIRNLTGLEFVALVNSRIESAIYGELESFGISFMNIVETLTVLYQDLMVIKDISKDEYLDSNIKLKDNMIILSATLRLEKDSPESIDNRIDWFRYIRGSVAPIEANIGPVFEDFDDIKAYEMVERVGGLDMKAGTMRWHKRFPNYIVNECVYIDNCSTDMSKASDVLSLIDDTKKKIEQHYALNPKINIKLLS
ncbi:UDP-N-acetylmuramate dehydrogenase [Brachyspira pilosicoli]|uniref:UDP-N-acetylmuramate dehydrogenase n=1 Tax=Brachyspira pilosicoli TaxID=52584 RepID=UPI003003B464